jgi:cytochrome c oxidase assembly protein subunit 15
MKTLARVALALALVVVVLSAHIRLAASGLGCAGWPACYGAVASVPAGRLDLAQLAPAALAHRLAATLLAIAVMALAAIAWRQRRTDPGATRITTALVLLTVALAALGVTTPAPRWPLLTLANLLGGIALAGLLWWLLGRESGGTHAGPGARLRLWAWSGLAMLGLTIALGGWVSANYAAAACDALGSCGQAGRAVTVLDAFNLTRALEVTADGRVSVPASAATIHTAHRLLSLLATLFLGWLALRAWALGAPARTAGTLLALVAAQLLLGFAMVAAALPLWLATTHNAAAVLLWLAALRLLQRF